MAETAQLEILDGVESILQELDDDTLTQSGYPFHTDALAVKQSSDPKTMRASFVIVTRQPKPNRHGNFCQITEGPDGKGLLLDNYRTNPVVQLNHGYNFALPIGISEEQGEAGRNLLVSLAPDKAVATCVFSQRLEEAEKIFQLVDEGVMRAASIQFRPTKARRMSYRVEGEPQPKSDIETMRDYGWDFLESELLEWSIVTIGADPGAIRKMLSSRGSPRLRQGLFRALEPFAEKPKTQVQGADFAKPEGKVVDTLSTDLANKSTPVQNPPIEVVQGILGATIQEAIAIGLAPFAMDVASSRDELKRLTG